MNAPSRLPLLALLLIPALPGCERRLDPETDGDLALAQNLRRSGRLDVWAPAGLRADLEPLPRAWSRVAGGLDVRLIEGELSGQGVARMELRVEAVAPPLPRELELAWEGSPALEAVREAADELVWIECGDLGALDRLPDTLVRATSQARLRDALPDLRPGWHRGQVLTWRGEVVFVRRGDPAAIDEDPTRTWIADPGAFAFALDPLKSSPGWTVRADGIEAEVLDDYLSAAGTMRARLSRWCAPAEAEPWHLIARSRVPGPHPDVTPEGAAIGPRPPQRLARVDRPSRTVFAYLLGDGLHDSGRELARALVHETLGAPARTWLSEGVGWEAADAHAGVELQRWCARLGRLAELPTLAQLMGDEGPWSHHVIGPLRGLLVRVILEQDGGAERLRAAWGGEPEALAELEGLEDTFRSRLAQLVERYPAQRRSAPDTRRVGAVMTASSYGTPMGSEESRLALGYLHHAGANSVALWTESAEGVDPDPGAAYLPRHHRGAGEGDVGLLAACRQARAFDLDVVLMPQLLATPSGLPAGQLVRVFDERWRELFDDHVRFTEHHALLAELGGASHLVVGHTSPEMARVVWTRLEAEPDDLTRFREIKREGWGRTLESARAAFAGELLFSMPAPQHLDLVDFWDRVDGVGVGCFPYLQGDGPGAGPPGDDRVRAQLTSFLEPALVAAQRAGRPLWILPVGFRSTALGWAGPGRDGGPPDLRGQARLLRLFDDVLDGVLARDPALVGGVMVWRWSNRTPGANTYPDGRRDRSIRGVLAERVLAELAE